MTKPRILFLCTGNSCRSQMAEALARALHGEAFVFASAGLEAQGINPRAATVMAESGWPLTEHVSKTLDRLLATEPGFDWVVSVCDRAEKSCPGLTGVRRLHCAFADPPALAAPLLAAGADEEAVLDCYRQVRDQIARWLQQLPQHLEENQ